MSNADHPDPIAAHARWQQRRYDELAAPDSWLGLCGLFWLNEGDNRVGAEADSDVVIPAGAPHVGLLRVRGMLVHWLPVEGKSVDLQTDRDGAPTTVNLEKHDFFIAERDGRLAARVRDPQWAEHQPFSGLSYLPYDPAWVIDAKWLPLDPPQTMELPNVLGELRPVSVAFCAQFMFQGELVSLLPVSVDEEGAFFVFRDRTSGRESYGAGRFLRARPTGSQIRLDFNRAYNPPCAFTPFATCPLPPPENWLQFQVMVGELAWEKSAA